MKKLTLIFMGIFSLIASDDNPSKEEYSESPGAAKARALSKMPQTEWPEWAKAALKASQKETEKKNLAPSQDSHGHEIKAQ